MGQIWTARGRPEVRTSSWIRSTRVFSPSIQSGGLPLLTGPPSASRGYHGKMPSDRPVTMFSTQTSVRRECGLRRTFDTGKPTVSATAHIINNQGLRVPIRISAGHPERRSRKDHRRRGNISGSQSNRTIAEGITESLHVRGYHRPQFRNAAPVRHSAPDCRKQQHRPDRRRKRHRQGTVRQGHPQSVSAAEKSGLYRLIAPPCRTRCWKANFSATRPVHSRMPSGIRPAGSPGPMVATLFSG